VATAAPRPAPLPAISLFSNCGAGDLGFSAAGFQFDVMAELDPRRLSVALLNHPSATGVAGDLRLTLPEVLVEYRKRGRRDQLALLAACPPCQGLSSAQSERGSEQDADAGSRDHRNLLVEVIRQAARNLEPRAIVVENVQAFLTRQVRHPRTNEPVSAAIYLIEELADDYLAYPLLADLADFGVPQSRKRSFLTLLRRDEKAVSHLLRRSFAPYPFASHMDKRIPLGEALTSLHLPSLDAISFASATSDVDMHMVPVWPPERYAMVKAIPPGSGLSAWDNDTCSACGCRAPDRTVAVCAECGSVLPRPVVRRALKRDLDEPRLVTGFKTSYKRMHPHEPASTVTTASGHIGSDSTIHPFENRVLSPLECSLLQTIPRSFQWGEALDRWGHTNVRAMIGEAVPPLFTHKHGRILAQLLRGIAPRVSLSSDDSRVLAADRAMERSRRMIHQ
jgi:DNA (cytosine-5)-methyltransferase 1